MKLTRREKDKLVKVVVISLALLVLVAVGLFFLNKWEEKKGGFSEQRPTEDPMMYYGVEYEPDPNIETFMVLGLDKYEDGAANDSYNNDKLADLVMLFVFDNEKKQCTAVHIDRDTIVDINVLGVAGNKVSTHKGQIALSHTYGNGKDVSCHNVADSISSLMHGIKIDHYASLTMDAVPILNDLVGGVEVEVLDDFSGIDDRLVKGEKVTLMGDLALKYVRSRSGLEDSSNSSRMKRQQQYVNALYEKIKSSLEADADFALDAATAVSEYMVSDRSVTQMQTLADKFEEYEFMGIKSLKGESVHSGEYIEFHPDADALKGLVVDLFYDPKEK